MFGHFEREGESRDAAPQHDKVEIFPHNRPRLRRNRLHFKELSAYCKQGIQRYLFAT
jgi:hypothetical protein